MTEPDQGFKPADKIQISEWEKMATRNFHDYFSGLDIVISKVKETGLPCTVFYEALGYKVVITPIVQQKEAEVKPIKTEEKPTPKPEAKKNGETVPINSGLIEATIAEYPDILELRGTDVFAKKFLGDLYEEIAPKLQKAGLHWIPKTEKVKAHWGR